MNSTVSFPVLLEHFFTQRLMAQRRASPHTIGSYRDTFRLLLQFARKRLRKQPSKLRAAIKTWRSERGLQLDKGSPSPRPSPPGRGRDQRGERRFQLHDYG